MAFHFVNEYALANLFDLIYISDTISRVETTERIPRGHRLRGGSLGFVAGSRRCR